MAGRERQRRGARPVEGAIPGDVLVVRPRRLARLHSRGRPAPHLMNGKSSLIGLLVSRVGLVPSAFMT